MDISLGGRGWVLAFCLAGCGAPDQELPEPVETTVDSSLSFEEFKATLPVHEDGVRYVVEDDILLNEEQLIEYWSTLPSANPTHLIINEVDGSTPLQSLTMSYCVDNSFTSTEKTAVINAITTVVGEWSAAAGRTFTVTHNSAQDGSGCTSSNGNVSFNVRRVSGASSSFFPRDARSLRELRVRQSAITSSDFLGVMRHEFGHVYGFRHEHIRLCPASDDSAPYQGLTRLDRPSVMHYNGQCGDTSTTYGNLSTYDRRGARCAYSGECEWVPVSGQARDIGVSSNGHVWIIGNSAVSGGYNIYRRDGSSWTQVSGGGVAIAVEPGGAAWIVNAAQNIYRWNGSSFSQVSGRARDVGVGANGTVWIIGNSAVSGGYNIYRRDGSSWTQVSGGGVRISVDPNGRAWIVNNAQNIYRYNGSSFVQESGQGRDISIGGDGSIWIVGNSSASGGYTIHERVGSEWFKVTGSASRIAAGDGTPWVVNSSQSIYFNRWE